MTEIITDTAEIILSTLNALRPPPEFTISEWSDTHRRLPRISSSEAGQWRTSRTPYLREIMDDLSPCSHFEDVVLMKGSQIGGTEVLLNFILFYMAHSPCPILAVQPTITTAERWSKQRLQPSIIECDDLKGKVADNRSRDASNTTLQKDFPGGTLIIGGANSAAALRSMPIQILAMDEPDAYPDDVDGEGDPVELAVRRTTNFSRRKRFYCSTPTVADNSRIEKLFNLSDQRYYYVPCPQCGEFMIIQWANLKFTDRNPDTVYLQCESCGQKIHEHYKTGMLARGEWRKHNPGSRVAGFHISALYSPVGWYSWKNAVRDHLNALGDPLKRKVWVNTVLGEVWELTANTIDSHWLMKRREEYAAEVPGGVLVLTAGVDTQDDRIECTVVGWGYKHESWVIDHAVFRGDPSREDVWTLLDQYLLKSWQHESGRMMVPACSCIDAMGHHTDDVYKFCSSRMFRRVFPVQGRGGSGRPIVTSSSKNKRARVYLFQVGVDQAKETIYSRLKIDEPGPGYVHFPAGLAEEYFHGLTSERRVTRHASGLPRLQWVLPPGRRNEPLDMMVYNTAALQILNPNLDLLAAENTVFSPDYQTSPAARRTRRVLSKGVTL